MTSDSPSLLGDRDPWSKKIEWALRVACESREVDPTDRTGHDEALVILADHDTFVCGQLERQTENAALALGQAKRLRTGLRAAIEGLDLAAGIHEAVDMGDDGDEAIKMRAVGTMRLALAYAKDMLADAE